MATIGGYPAKKLIKNCYLSALVGATSGLSYRQLKKRPVKLKKIFGYSFAAGGTGLLLGSCYGWFRKSPNVFVKGLSGGVNFFLITGCYFGVREALMIGDGFHLKVENKKIAKYEQSAASGAITGFVVGSFWWWSVFRIFSTSVAFCTLAATGQFINDKFNNWKSKNAVARNYPELMELEWLVLEEEEKEKIRKKQQGWISWAIEFLLDRPYSGKVKQKIEAIEEELQSLDNEETILKAKLNIVEPDNESSNVAMLDSR